LVPGTEGSKDKLQFIGIAQVNQALWDGGESKTQKEIARASAELEKAELHSFVVNRVEKELISQVLASCNNVQTKAAGKLGINRNTLHKKLKEYGLEGAESEPE